MITGGICPVTALLSGLGVSVSAYAAFHKRRLGGVFRFASVSAFIFAAQMVNFPVSGGTSGHFLGGVMAAVLLGIPLGILSMALVIIVQTLVFSDGSFAALGANILNMALIGAGMGGLIYRSLLRHTRNRGSAGVYLAATVSSWVSVMLSAGSCSILLAAGGPFSLKEVAPQMLGVHAITGLGEAFITCVSVALFAGIRRPLARHRSFAVPLGSAAAVALFLSPFASAYPDGLEKTVSGYAPRLLKTLSETGLFRGYSIPFAGEGPFSVSAAGFAGVIITFTAAALSVRYLSALFGAGGDTSVSAAESPGGTLQAERSLK
jgi:cobalt/nickel transport system permease protein